jgi:hypothetical protein
MPSRKTTKIKTRKLIVSAVVLLLVIYGLVYGANWFVTQNPTEKQAFPTESEAQILGNKLNYNEMVWKEYENKELGFRLMYPSNYVLPREAKNTFHLLKGSGYIFSIRKNLTNLPLAEWWESYKSDHPYQVASETTFRNEKALLLKLIAVSQVPVDTYLVKFGDSIYEIGFEVEYRDEIYKEENYKVANEEFYKVDKKVIDEILSSFRFLN